MHKRAHSRSWRWMILAVLACTSSLALSACSHSSASASKPNATTTATAAEQAPPRDPQLQKERQDPNVMAMPNPLDMPKLGDKPAHASSSTKK